MTIREPEPQVARGRLHGAARWLLAAALLLGGCAHPVASSLRAAVDRGQPPEDLHVQLDDHSASSGGEQIDIRSDGTVEVRRFQPGAQQPQPVRRGEVAAARVIDLVRKLVDIEAWQQRIEGGADERVDDRKVVLTIETGGGRSRVWEWASDLEVTERLILVQRIVLRLAREALGEAY